jgi:serine/threonine-protein kinase
MRSVVAGYRLERRLGTGGSGEVWLGRHQRTGGVAAVKLLKKRRATSSSAFAREERAIARLHHPHIVSLFEAGPDYLVTAFVDGGDLQRRQRELVPPQQALDWIRQVGSALEHAHMRGVIHRDVKPGNILLDGRGNAYLSDFGLALLPAEEAPPDLGGTPAYMAPEQRRGEIPGPAADQYSLGRTLLALLAGAQLPIDPLEALELLPAAVPAALKRLLARATRLLPQERFPSLSALNAELRAVSLEGVSSAARLVEPRRKAEPLAWSEAAHHREAVGPDLERADFRLSDLAGALPVDHLAALRTSSGLREMGWSVYGRTDRLGPIGPEALSRAQAVVVLMHSWLLRRWVWAQVAPAICRDNPLALVLTPDLHGCGETRFAADPPNADQISPRALMRTVQDWLGLLGLDKLPTVLVGHSYSAHALMTLGDEELAPHTARVAITPFIPIARNEKMLRLFTRVLATTSRHPALWAAFRVYFLRRQRRILPLSEELIQHSLGEIRAIHPRTLHLMMRELGSSQLAEGRLERCVVMFGDEDPMLQPDSVPLVVDRYRVAETSLRWIAGGGHYPFVDHRDHPEAINRNRDELVRTIDEVLQNDTTPSRATTTATTQLTPG